jgi:hypothetical protein
MLQNGQALAGRRYCTARVVCGGVRGAVGVSQCGRFARQRHDQIRTLLGCLADALADGPGLQLVTGAGLDQTGNLIGGSGKPVPASPWLQ